MTTSAALVPVEESWLKSTVERIFGSLGYSPTSAASISDSLVEADRRGVRSHGTMRVPMYVERIMAGSVSRHERAEVVRETGAICVLDARHALGALTSDQAMGLAIEKAAAFGVGAVAVRHGFHFGAASRYVLQAAESGYIGIAAANTRPLMAAIGGAEAVVGNNPLAIGAPSADGTHFVLDMALSEAAFGKIKAAEQSGTRIPESWATGPDGSPTTDPAEAIRGLLLPAGGAKGFGLAVMVDVLTGVLSGGAWGDGVQGLYTGPDIPNDCSHFFLALNIEAFTDPDEFRQQVAAMATRVRDSRRAPGVGALFTPGEPEWNARGAAGVGWVLVDGAVVADLEDLERSLAGATPAVRN
jgi:LDH2 family malate/lactate/ureidoglycolate dehydrogenase